MIRCLPSGSRGTQPHSFPARITLTMLVAAVRVYQGLVRPFLFGTCKFCPTCSEYMIEALHGHGLWRGGLLGVRRLLRCHPFGRGGLDPVPSAVIGHGSIGRGSTECGDPTQQRTERFDTEGLRLAVQRTTRVQRDES